jgi:hypothetical protein
MYPVGLSMSRNKIILGSGGGHQNPRGSRSRQDG